MLYSEFEMNWGNRRPYLKKKKAEKYLNIWDIPSEEISFLPINQ